MMRKLRGMALLLALFMLVFLFILGITFRFLTDQHYIFASDVAHRTELVYLAEAGLEYCIARRAYWPDGVPPADERKFKLNSGWVIIGDIADSGSSFRVITKGKFLDEPSASQLRNNCVTIIATVDSTGNVISKEIRYEDYRVWLTQ